jgi:hypothetical protein
MLKKHLYVEIVMDGAFDDGTADKAVEGWRV